MESGERVGFFRNSINWWVGNLFVDKIGQNGEAILVGWLSKMQREAAAGNFFKPSGINRRYPITYYLLPITYIPIPIPIPIPTRPKKTYPVQIAYPDQKKKAYYPVQTRPRPGSKKKICIPGSNTLPRT